MAVREAVKRLVWAKARGMCAFNPCRKDLVEESTHADSAVTIGEIAHIVDQSVAGGARADQPVPGGDRDGEPNLMLLCPDHHTIIDAQPSTHTVERLLGMKAAHEKWARDQLRTVQRVAPTELVEETIHSTLLAVDQIPKYVYLAPCDKNPPEIAAQIRYPHDRNVHVPFILRGKSLITFADLTNTNGLFADVLSRGETGERHNTADWLRDPDHTNWLVTLLNRAIGKHAVLRKLSYDKEHRRHYFEPLKDASGNAAMREEEYRPPNAKTSKRQVAWNPITRKTGLGKRYWLHLAVGLRFIRVSPANWILALRPEHRFTRDGFIPLSPKGTGKKATSKKSRMYNSDLLSEVVFWRSYLTQDQPRLILDLSGQSLIIDAQLMGASIRWPGVPGDRKPFANVEVVDDLFTMAAYSEAMAQAGGAAELDDIELDDIAALEAEVDEDAVAEDDVPSIESALPESPYADGDE